MGTTSARESIGLRNNRLRWRNPSFGINPFQVLVLFIALYTVAEPVNANGSWMPTEGGDSVGALRVSNMPTRGSFSPTAGRSKHSINRSITGSTRSLEAMRRFITPAMKTLNPEETKKMRREWCYSLPGLVLRQRRMCLENPKLVSAAIRGTEIAERECRRQFRYNRWNCSLIFSGINGVEARNGNKDGRRKSGAKGEYLAPGLRNATKEGAFLHAIMSAGIAHAVTVACRNGELSACHCDQSVSKLDVVMEILREIIKWNERKSKGGGRQGAKVALERIRTRNLFGASEYAKNRTRAWSARRSASGISWKEEVEQISWGGCSDDVRFGVRFSRRFVEAPYNDLPPRKRTSRDDVILHNGEVGRRMVQALTKVHCRCHGMSGSCTAQTCWMQMASFEEVGDALKRKYTAGIKAMEDSKPRRRLRHITDSGRMRRVPKTELAYINDTPNLCREDKTLGIAGTAGRQCLKHSGDAGDCRVLCCGRGYNSKQVVIKRRCKCKFVWCCDVRCQECDEVQNEFTCKA